MVVEQGEDNLSVQRGCMSNKKCYVQAECEEPAERGGTTFLRREVLNQSGQSGPIT
jgi:hypothetical protein